MIDPNYPNDVTELGGSGLFWMTPSHPKYRNVSLRKSDADDPDEVILRPYCTRQGLPYDLMRAILADQGTPDKTGTTFDPDYIDLLYDQYGPPNDLLTAKEASRIVSYAVLKTVTPAWSGFGFNYYRETDVRARQLEPKPRNYSVQRAMMTQQYQKFQYQKTYPTK